MAASAAEEARHTALHTVQAAHRIVLVRRVDLEVVHHTDLEAVHHTDLEAVHHTGPTVVHRIGLAAELRTDREGDLHIDLVEDHDGPVEVHSLVVVAGRSLAAEDSPGNSSVAVGDLDAVQGSSVMVVVLGP